ncbi:hypothetical protein KKF34_16270 [Myxococcota bacterium]|nr:hypothetical protein [Myxococcota bacterium]MBU1381381.1 hypothetical protein [Myxococcota bacterium]MBU1498433.1 hypothetical protein [Myxococcota bacterium]
MYKNMSFLFLALVFLSVGCSNPKTKIANENNQLVSIHRKMVGLLTETVKFKNDPPVFLKKAETMTEELKKLEKQTAKIAVSSELKDIKNHLMESIKKFATGYDEAVSLYKNDNKIKAQQKFAQTEVEFHKDNKKLISLQKSLAAKMNFKVKTTHDSSKGSDMSKAPAPEVKAKETNDSTSVMN